MDADRVASGGRVLYDFPGPRPVQFVTEMPRTADGKVHLTPAELGPTPYRWTPPDDEHPLALVTPASSHLVTSTFGEFNEDELRLTVHPDDAAARSIRSGDGVRVFNDLGTVDCVARVSDRVRPGVVSMPKGTWMRSSGNGATSTALTPDDAQVVGDAACFNDARVEVEKLADA